MLLRRCGEIGRGARSSTELGRWRRHRLDSMRMIDWPTEPRVAGPPDDGSDERRVARPASRAGRGLAAAPFGPSWLWQLLGQSSAAREQWSDLLRLTATSADREVRAETLNVVGRFASAGGDLATAQAFFQEALVAGRAGQASGSVARSLSGLAQAAASRGAFDLAYILEEEALMIRRRLGDTAETARSLAVLAWFSLVEQALRAAGSHPTHDRHGTGNPAEPMPLTPRELEVATLIGHGHTNRRIAEVLVIAERTAETHARNIREKLGLATRAQIAAWAATRRLLATES